VGKSLARGVKLKKRVGGRTGEGLGRRGKGTRKLLGGERGKFLLESDLGGESVWR